MSGENPSAKIVLLFVIAIAPKVRPWYAPCIVMMFCLRVMLRTILSAASTASEPELVRKNESSEGCGMMGSRRSMRRRYGSWYAMLHWHTTVQDRHK